jgi:hypothetical protein
MSPKRHWAKMMVGQPELVFGSVRVFEPTMSSRLFCSALRLYSGSVLPVLYRTLFFF